MDIMLALRDSPKSPTKLMYVTNVSWMPVQECLRNLVLRGLIIESDHKSRRKVYSLTEKGRNLVDQYSRFMKELVI